MIDLNKLQEIFDAKKKKYLLSLKNSQLIFSEMKRIIENLNKNDIYNVNNKLPSVDEKGEILACFPLTYDKFFGTSTYNKISDYVVCAVDGSNTEIDRHKNILYYFLNISMVTLTYNSTNSSFNYKVEPFLYIEDELINQQNGFLTLKSSSHISEERQMLEFRAINQFVESYDNDAPCVIFYDGGIVDWSQNRQDKRFGRMTFDYVEYIFKKAQSKNIALCGYISSPKNVQISNFYRAYKCHFEKIRCEKCEEKEVYKCDEYSRIKDVNFFSYLNVKEFSNFYRTTNRSNSETLLWDVVFCYLNTGSEIARLEIPFYVYRDNKLLSDTLSIVISQVEMGKGYPIALTHAHNFCVLTPQDRQMLDRMVLSIGENKYNINQISSKKVNKIRRIL